MNIFEILESNNIADDLDKEELEKIGALLSEALRTDLASIEGWQDKTEEYTRLATQISEEKNFPWPGAANVKYPMLTTAALQFSSRAYPALIQGNNPVKIDSVGFDPGGEKAELAGRISKHMSYQLLHQMEEWEEDMDRMLMALPIVGTAFKKTFFCQKKKRNISEYINPKDFVINFHAKSVEAASRKFHKLSLTENEIIEFIRKDFYIDVDLDQEAQTTNVAGLEKDTQGVEAPPHDDDRPYILHEAHVFLDLDDDGYKEPYIVTFFEDTSTVVRIVPRFSLEKVEFYKEDKVACITPEEYFTGYIFIPDPVSKIYGLGFGNLLGPLNETTNTIMNQLLDAGTMSVTGGGFLGRGFKTRNSGPLRFSPNEWKYTNASGDDLRKSIFPLPVREPSVVLFSLLGTVLDSGQKLSSTMDIMVGESPGQNQAATTTMAVLEQGLKVFTSIHKRVYRSLRKELKKMFELNAEYLEYEEYFRVLDPVDASGKPGPTQGRVTLTDYHKMQGSMDISPAGDPNAVTQAQKLIKAEALMQLAGTGQINVNVATKRMLEAQEQPNISELMEVPPPQPDPEVVLKQMEMEHKINYDNRKLELDAVRIASEAVKDEGQSINQLAQAEATVRESDLQDLQGELDAAKSAVETLHLGKSGEKT